MWSHDFWGSRLDSPKSHNSWRPLTSLSFALQSTGNLDKLGDLATLHLFNIVLHGLNVCLFRRLIRAQFASSTVSFLSLLFAAHPLASEAVCSLVGRADLFHQLCLLSSLLMMRSNLQQRAIYSSIICAISVLFKETGLVTFPIVAFVDLAAKRTFKQSQVWPLSTHQRRRQI